MKNKTLFGLIALILLGCNMGRSQQATKPSTEEIIRLEAIHQADQESREKLINILTDEGNKSEAFKEQNKRVNSLDSKHVAEITSFLDRYGWSGDDVIGETANRTLFLVIQHADLPTQEKYLPMLKDAVSKGNAQPSFMAMLVDRIAVRNGEKQIYGSQLDIDTLTGQPFLSPILDPENVDKRRADVGLQPLAEYVAIWGLQWDIEKHKLKHKN